METIERTRYAATDPRLGRHVHHDSRSKAYPFAASGGGSAVRWRRQVPVFDQGQLGSCTGNAALGCLGTDPFHDDLSGMEFSEQEAVHVYSIATTLDGFTGQYKPDDTGSDGLSAAKALKLLGMISGYQHIFSTDDAVAALATSPWITGVNWYEGMFTPSVEGLVTISGALAGGHEFYADEYDPARGWIGFTNSWGEGWGLAGRFYMEVETFSRLQYENGDVTIFTPISAPAPTPAPSVDTDVATLAKAVATWRKRGIPAIGAVSAQRAVRKFLAGRGV